MGLWTNSNILVVDVQNSQPLVVDMYDLQGKLIKKVFDGTANEGGNQYAVDVQDLNAGVYLYRVQGSEFSRTIKFSKY